MKAREVNFDGLVGLTHHYAGLSFGKRRPPGIVIRFQTPSGGEAGAA